MKKSLIALAVLAASGAAMAQSTVTLYGVADVWVGSQKSGLTGVSQTKMGSGGYNGSRFGFRGTEDLGGGLTANFVLEQGFNIDDSTGPDSDSKVDGVQMTQQFNRQAFVGLSGGFGTTRFGRQYTAYDELRGATNNSFDTAFATTGTVWGDSKGRSAVADYAGRVNNQLYYATPVFGGVSGAIGYGLGENKDVGVNATDTLSLHVKYAAGPLLVGVAYQNEEVDNTADRSYTLIAGSYDFGVAKLTAGFNRAKQDGDGKDSEYQLGVSVPVSGNAAVALGYTHAKGKNLDGSTFSKGSGWSLTGYYDLSKRTRLYAGYNNTNAKNGAGVKVDKNSLFAVGMRHSF